MSDDPPKLTRERYKKYGAFAFPVLSDPVNAVARTYAPSQKNGEDGNLLLGNLVINRQDRVTWSNREDGLFTENRTLLVELHRRGGAAKMP